MTATATSSAATAQQGHCSTPPARRLDPADRDMDLGILRSPRPGLGSGGEMSEQDKLWPGRVRRIGRERLRRWKLDVLCEPVELCLSELVTNAMRYGRGPVVGVRLYRTTSHLLIEVSDGSPDRPVLGDAGSDEEGGRGLALVDAVAESWGVSEDGTCTWCRLSVPKGQP
ncbi:ATP-binding protein [Streptomyces sp. B1I3]|uniref:ATP-binding protein n=1 Tax=Streptomyces sp. B1I3 TaxID=3042264 RepID=UPI002780A147|nr:ATP-binding protein [Streptomyces sp. B1I3]MDQ0798204.1 anti-sigma regulatory factor (Ser/Thr protein kinase) [Streptomyces sp. B1I3]